MIIRFLLSVFCISIMISKVYSNDTIYSASLMNNIFINELSSRGTVDDGDDWIEIFNAHSSPVFIKDSVFISDKNNNRKMHELKGIIIPSNGFVILKATGDTTKGKHHLLFSLSSNGESLFLSRYQGNTLVLQDSLTFPALQYNTTFGRVIDATSINTIFIQPTYNASNNNAIQKLDLRFSHQRGLYDSTFLLTLTSEPNTIIKYTTDNSTPTFANGLVYNNGIIIDKTMSVKAIAYNSSQTAQSFLETHSYILKTNFPQDSMYFKYKNNITNEEYKNALNDLPIVSFNTQILPLPNNVDYFPSSFEYIDNHINSSSKNIQSNCGVTKFGQTTLTRFINGNYKFKFNDDYGVKKIQYSFFDTLSYDNFKPTNTISRLELKISNYGDKIMDYVCYRTLKQMGAFALNTKFVHFIGNGRYMGTRVIREDFNAHNLEEYFGDDDDNYTKVDLKDGNYLTGIVETGDGSMDKWNEIKNLINANDFQGIKQKVEVKEYIKNLILLMLSDMETEVEMIGHNDAPNFTKFRTLLADTDGAFHNINIFPLSIYRYVAKWSNPLVLNGPAGLAGKFIGTANVNWGTAYTNVGNLEFKTWLKDIIRIEMESIDGALTVNSFNSKIVEAYEIVEHTQKIEEALFGVLPNSYDMWKDNVQQYQNHMPTRLNYVLNEWRKRDLTHRLKPTSIIANPIISSIDSISIQNNDSIASQIYYTLDGTDPMGNDGIVAPNAFLYSNKFVLPVGNYVITTRTFIPKNWGPMTQASINVIDVINTLDLAITNIQYKPLSNSDAEFLVVTNISNNSIDISNYKFTDGIVHTFLSGTVLLPNEKILIAKNLDLVQNILPQIVQRQQWTSGSLNNSGELLVLIDTLNNIEDSLTYKPTAPWPIDANGTGKMLQLKELNLDNAIGENWEAIDVDTVITKINKNELIGMTIYPMPFKDKIHLKIDNNDLKYPIKVSMFDILGRKKIEQIFDTNEIILNTHALEKNVYFIKISDAKGVNSKSIKVIKQ